MRVIAGARIFGRIQKKTAGTASRVIHRFTFLGFQITDNDIYHFLRGIELAGHSAALVFIGKTLDEVFVSVAQDIHRNIVVAQIHRTQIVDEVGEYLWVKFFAAGAIGGRLVPSHGVDDAFQEILAVFVDVLLGNGIDSGVQLLVFLVDRSQAHIIPKAAGRNCEIVFFLGDHLQFTWRRLPHVVNYKLFFLMFNFPLVIVGKTFEKQQ